MSRTGHISREIDLLFYNQAETVVLMRFPGVLEHYPAESVHGVIQVKSRLTSKSLQEALENIASYKRLERPTSVVSENGMGFFQSPTQKGFGVIFAYESDLTWQELVSVLEHWANSQPSRIWPNAVVVLRSGFFRYGQDNRAVLVSDDLEKITNPTVFGFPDRNDSCLYSLYLMLMNLLSKSSAWGPNIEEYFSLPQTADELSYRFSWGVFAELGQCELHGRYLREITPYSLRKIISAIENEPAINWIRATDLAYGKPDDDEEKYHKQPGDVKIYNTDNLPLPDILVQKDGSGLSLTSIDVANTTVWYQTFM